MKPVRVSAKLKVCSVSIVQPSVESSILGFQPSVETAKGQAMTATTPRYHRRAPKPVNHPVITGLGRDGTPQFTRSFRSR